MDEHNEKVEEEYKVTPKTRIHVQVRNRKTYYNTFESRCKLTLKEALEVINKLAEEGDEIVITHLSEEEAFKLVNRGY